MKLVTSYLESIEGIEVFAYIGLAIFLLFFVAVTIHTLLLPREDIREFENIPFDDKMEESNLISKKNKD